MALPDQSFLFSPRPDSGKDKGKGPKRKAAAAGGRSAGGRKKKASGAKKSDAKKGRAGKKRRKRRPKSAAGTEPVREVGAKRDEILSGVTDRQREAIEHVEGPMLVLAGAGSGKTRVITTRVAHLIDRGAHPRSILSITFTNKAANEMKERVRSLVGGGGAWVSTFHSFCARLLREDIETLNAPQGSAATGTAPAGSAPARPVYRREFVIYDESDAETTVKDAVKETGLAVDIRPAAVRNAISRWKTGLVSPDRAESVARGKTLRALVCARAYRVYERLLRERGALDFDDLLLKALEVLRVHEDVRAKWNRRYRFLQVDEYQDTNRIQYELVKLLAGPEKNVVAVGDPDQSIYSWRGADPRNTSDFLRDYPDTKVVKLDKNFRSKQAILDAASALIEHNSGPRAGALKGTRGQGETARLVIHADARAEADDVAKRIGGIVRKSGTSGTSGKSGRPGRSLRDVAVFYRTNAQSRPFEQAFMERGVPYVVVGAVAFYKRKEVKDALGYLRVAMNRADDVGFRRIVNTPRRGIGPGTLGKLADAAEERGVPIAESIRDPSAFSALPKKATTNLARLDALLGRLSELAKGPAGEVVRAAVEESGLYEMYLDTDEEERTENLEQLVSAAAEYDELHEGSSLAGFIEEAALIADIDRWDERAERVTLMTLHAAKGLEFPVVFVAGVEDGLLPHIRSISSGDLVSMEEERRLLYVGMTRAKDELALSCARSRRFGSDVRMSTRSRFLAEIPGEFLTVENLAGGYTRWESSARPGFRRTLKQQAQESFLIDDAIEPDADPDEEAKAIRRQIAAREALEDGGAGDGLLDVAVGQRVMHPIFGEGRVVAVKGAGRKAKVTIDFAGDRARTVALGFARLRAL